MAPKKRSFRDDPPSASSSESETESEVGAEEEEEEKAEQPQKEEEEEEEEEEEMQEGKPVPSPPRLVSQKKSESQSSDSDTESEPDRDGHSMHNGKPVPAKTPKKRGAGGVVSNGGEAPSLKRVKSEANSEGAERKFQRIWSESDEMEILKGLVEFSDRKKDNPVYDMNDLFDFLRGKISSFFTKQQLSGKIGTMKKRFMNCEKRKSKGSKLKPQDDAFVELARKVWSGSADNHVNEKKIDAASSRIESKEGTSVSAMSRWLSMELDRLRGDRTVDEEFIRKAMNLMDESKRAEFHERWMRLQELELQIVAERARLINAQAALVSQAYKLSRS